MLELLIKEMYLCCLLYLAALTRYSKKLDFNNSPFQRALWFYNTQVQLGEEIQNLIDLLTEEEMFCSNITAAFPEKGKAFFITEPT
jgi:hypothetical protein